MDLSRLLWATVKAPEDGLRAADILLRAGGFALVVISLYAIGAAPPWVTAGAWQRLVQQAEHTRTALLLIGEQPVAGSAACATIECRPGPAHWIPCPGGRLRWDRRTAAADRVGDGLTKAPHQERLLGTVCECHALPDRDGCERKSAQAHGGTIAQGEVALKISNLDRTKGAGVHGDFIGAAATGP